jgi:7-cyano-7-deazaguanine synthase in queuosine biosynthesis
MTDYTKLGFIPFEQVLEESKDGVKSLIVASGGLDSAYTLWKYYNTCKIKPVDVHHFNLYPNYATRQPAEEEALRQQCEFLGSDIKVYKTYLDSDIKIPLARDFHLAAFLSVNMAMKLKTKYIVIGDEILDGLIRSLPVGLYEEDLAHYEQLSFLKEYIKSYTNNSVQLSLNMSSPNVLEEYLKMPKDYLKLAFSCRNPTLKEFSAIACGNCISCHRNYLLGIKDLLSKQVIFKQKLS